MDKEQTKEAIKVLDYQREVMQAFVDDECVESDFRDEDSWIESNTPIWDWDTYDYRRKPKPREFWVNIYNDGTFFLHNDEEIAKSFSQEKYKTVKVREVLNE